MPRAHVFTVGWSYSGDGQINTAEWLAQSVRNTLILMPFA